MRTYKITGYQAYGTRDPSAYYVDVSYRGELLQRYSGMWAYQSALFYVSREAGRAVIHMGDKA